LPISPEDPIDICSRFDTAVCLVRAVDCNIFFGSWLQGDNSTCGWSLPFHLKT